MEAQEQASVSAWGCEPRYTEGGQGTKTGSGASGTNPALPTHFCLLTCRTVKNSSLFKPLSLWAFVREQEKMNSGRNSKGKGPEARPAEHRGGVLASVHKSQHHLPTVKLLARLVQGMGGSREYGVLSARLSE